MYDYEHFSTITQQRLRYGNVADTTPPKKHIKDMSQDFYSAGFVPGAIVYFAYDIPKGKHMLFNALI